MPRAPTETPARNFAVTAHRSGLSVCAAHWVRPQQVGAQKSRGKHGDNAGRQRQDGKGARENPDETKWHDKPVLLKPAKTEFKAPRPIRTSPTHPIISISAEVWWHARRGTSGAKRLTGCELPKPMQNFKKQLWRSTAPRAYQEEFPKLPTAAVVSVPSTCPEGSTPPLSIQRSRPPLPR